MLLFYFLNLGHQVTDTVRVGLSNNELLQNNTFDDSKKLLFGQVSILAGKFCFLTIIQIYKIILGCGAWLLTATFFKLPVSTTHSIVGATIGYLFVLGGMNCIRWEKVGEICT